MTRKMMKMMALLMLLASLFGACHKERSPFSSTNAPLHDKALKSIETLLETHPELALDSLKALKASVQNEVVTSLDANELLLREVQAQYKNRCLTDQTPDLQPVIAFYDSLALLFPDDADLQYLRANTYYYKGVECAFVNDDVEAFRNYLSALAVMKSREEWPSNYAKRFIALIYTRLSEILYSYGLFDEAREACGNASAYFEKDNDLAAMMRYEATIFQAEKAYDKALARFEQAEGLAPVGEDITQLAIGAKLFELQQFDSAYPHLKRAFNMGDHKTRADAAAKLAEICRTKGMTDEELRYTRFYVESSMRESRMTSKKMEIDYLYNEFTTAQTEEKTLEKENNAAVVFLLLLLIAVVGFLAFIIIRNRSRINHIENQIVDIKEKHRQENAVKDLEINQMAQQLGDARKRLEDVTNHTFEEAWQGFNGSDVVLKIKGMMEGNDIMIKNVGLFPKLKLKEVDFIDLVRTVNTNFTDCSQHFLKDFPELNSADFRQCCLAMLGMNDAQMAVLEGISYSGVNRRTKKILSAMQTENTLEQAILTYLRNNW